MNHAVALTLTEDEALVLEAFFARFEAEGRLVLRHNAEYVALSRVSAQLESVLVQPLQPSYESQLASARERVAEGFEGVAPGLEP
jgi:hypothetical protein